jgi:hypothetical protein
MNYRVLFGILVAVFVIAGTAAAYASAITYDFTVHATSGPLSGATSSGSFTFDSSEIVPGGGSVSGANLLSALSLYVGWNLP